MEHITSQFSPGEMLEVRYGRDNKWVPCTINSVEPVDQKYSVTLIDYDKEMYVDSRRLRKPRYKGTPWRHVEGLADAQGFFVCPNACGKRIKCTKTIYYKYHYGDRCAVTALPAPASRAVCQLFDRTSTDPEEQVGMTGVGNTSTQLPSGHQPHEHVLDNNAGAYYGDLDTGNVRDIVYVQAC